MAFIYILLVVLIVIVAWFALAYNRFVVLKNRTKEAWSDIEVQLKRRYDLIPNLVETVKGYATHESAVFEKVTEARAKAMGAGTMQDKLAAENALSSTLKTLFAVSENYPQLMAATNFLELQRELRDTEDKIQAARRFYNTNAMELNTKIESVPSNIVANIFKFEKAEFFETANEAEKQPVQVKF